MSATLETARLVLRPLAETDLVALADTINDRMVTRTTGTPPWPYRLDDAHAFLRQVQALPKGSCRYIIAPRNGALPVGGVIGLDGRAPAVAEIGYWLAAALWGKGYGLEAAWAVADHGFRTFGHDRLLATCAHGNDASRRILDRLGFRNVGHGHAWSNGAARLHRVARLELTAREWRSGAGRA